MLPFQFSAAAGIKQQPLPPVTTKHGKDNMYCWQLVANQACLGTQKDDCSDGLAKVEWWVNKQCRSAVASVWVNGVRRSGVWADPGTFRITPPQNATDLFGPHDVARAPHSVCIVLRSDNACPTLRSFCAGSGSTCTVALFDSPLKRSCPVMGIPI